MSNVWRARTISVSIRASPSKVYDFVSNPENLGKWASGLGSASTKNAANDTWTVQTPDGPVGLRFAPKNDHGILDHTVILPDEETLNPMRVVPNDEGSEIMFTLYQRPGMSDATFDRDAATVEADLVSLKRLMET